MGCINRINLCPASGDTENVLLQKILQSLNASSGGGGGVTSVNGNSGPAVLLTTDDIPEGSSNLYFTDARAIAATAGAYLLKAGDTGTGAFIFTPTADNVTPLTLTNSLTGASAVPALAINPTWNTTGAPTALLINATNTASSSSALLFDAQLGTVTVLNLRRDGRLSLAGRASFTDSSGVGHGFSASNASTAAATSAVNIQHVLSAGVPVAGFGATLNWNLDSTTTAATLAAREIVTWTDPAHATRTSRISFFTHTAGVLTTAMELQDAQIRGSSGTATLPTFSDRNDTNTGVYFSGADSLLFSTGGTLRLTLSTTELVSTLVIRGPAGSLSAPAFSFSGDSNTGIFSISADTLGITAAGALSFTVGAGFIQSAGPLFLPVGTAAAPALTFATDTNTGIFQTGVADTLGFSAGGVVRLTLNTTSLTSTVRHLGPAGTDAAPTYSFSGDPDTGIYSSGVNLIGMTAGATNFITFGVGGVLSGVPVEATQLRTPAGIPGVIFLGGPGGIFSAESGADGRLGNVALVGGTATVAVSSVTADTLVLLTRKTSGGTIGFAITYTLSVGTSFTITSDNVLDTSTFTYFLIEAPPG